MLMYAGLVAKRRGATVHRHWWSWSFDPPRDLGEQTANRVREDVATLIDKTGGRPLLIGKSLGTLAASVAAERSLPAIWLTPLLSLPHAVAMLEGANAPFLLAGGTADSYWDGTVARRLTEHVFEADGADHGMCVPGPAAESAAVLGRMLAALDGFLDAMGWPAG